MSGKGCYDGNIVLSNYDELLSRASSHGRAFNNEGGKVIVLTVDNLIVKYKILNKIWFGVILYIQF